MKNIKIVIAFCSCVCTPKLILQTVEISGPILAPWVKGQLCTYYWCDQKRVHRCFEIKMGQSYTIKDIPDRVRHIKVTRSFYKNCPAERKEKNKCKKADGKFFLNHTSTILDLTYKNNKVLLSYTLPPKQGSSYFGYPQQYGSVMTQPDYRSQPDSMAV